MTEQPKRGTELLYALIGEMRQHEDAIVLAKEVDEQEFFYSRETGGTVVSSALELMKTIVQERYPTDSWNIYAAQASDGENWADDSPKCSELLTKSLLPLVQYYAYVEISSGKEQELWRAYGSITEQFADPSAINLLTSVSSRTGHGRPGRYRRVL